MRKSENPIPPSGIRRRGARRAAGSPRFASSSRPRHLLRNFLLFSFSLSSIAAAASASAAPGRPMTIEDVVTAVRVADPQLSPDGKSVAFVRTTTDLAANRRNADVWLVPADGSAPPRALTSHEKADTAPRFSPDGKTLAFLSARSGTPQVWLLDLAGGEPRKLTDLAAGAAEPLVFSPDGTKLAFVSDVYPACPDEACNRKTREGLEKDPVKVHRLTHLLYRNWDEWRENVRHHVFVLDLASGAVTDVTPGDFDSPPDQYEDGGIAFSPDGKEIAFVSNRDGADAEAFDTNKDVFTVPVTGGAAVKLTTGNPAADFEPVYTPDGASIVVRAQRRAGFEADRWWLDVYDRKTKAKRTVFETPDLSVEEFCLSPDGKTVYFTADREGRRDLFEVSLAGGTPREVKRGGAIGSLQAGRGLLVFTEASLIAPPEILSLPLEEKAATPAAKSLQATAEAPHVRALTDENRSWLKDVAVSAPESLSATGAGGARVQYWLIKPPAFDPAKKYPVVFLIHGGPQGAWEDGWSARWNPTLWAAQGWVVALPNPRGSTGFGQKFVDEISGDWGGKVMTDLDAVFDAVVKLPFVDATRQGIAGASYGGYAVDWILGHTNRFKAAVTHDGVFNLESMSLATEELWFSDWEFGGRPWSEAARKQFAKWSPHLYAQNIRTPTLIVTNELDFRVPVDQGLQMFTVLRGNGVPAEALVFPDEGHWVLKPANSRRWHDAVFSWMKTYLGR